MNVWIDENLSPKLAKCLNEIVWFNVRSIPEFFGKGVLDAEWIPKVKNEIVITADYKMRYATAERPLIEENNIGLFLIKPPSKNGLGYWE